jgi:hypothetical protein
MTDFALALREAGYVPPPDIRTDGHFQRFGPKLTHWLIFDGQFGAAGDWRGEKPRLRWKTGGECFFSPTEKRLLREQARAAFHEYQSDREQRALEAAEQAAILWQTSKTEGTSEYLTRKQVPAIGCRFGHEAKTGRSFLAVPLRDTEGKLWSIQKIYDDGTKLFLKGSRKYGCFHALGNIFSNNSIYFCEGYATAASVHLATGHAAIACCDAGNLDPVIESLRSLYPTKTFIIAADNDAFSPVNTGRQKAEEAAARHGCSVVLPHFKNSSSNPTDFNDLHVLEGIEEVRRQLTAGKVTTNQVLWPEPDLSLIDADQATPPTFDYTALPNIWAAWVKEQASALGCPADYVAASLLASASAWLGNSRRVAATTDWIEPPHLWFALIGAPSTGKTPAQRPFIEICKMLEREERPAWEEKTGEHEKNIEAVNAKLDKWKADVKLAVKNNAAAPDRPQDAVLPDAPALPRLVINDSTIEEATNILAGNPKGLLMVRDELSGWIGSFDRYGGDGSDRAFYLECWNGGSHSVDRVKKSGQPVEVPYASLAILGGIQPDKLRETLAGADDGFTARFLYVWPLPLPFQPLAALSAAQSEGRMNLLLSAARRLRSLAMNSCPLEIGTKYAVILKAQLVPLAETVAFDSIRREALDKARATQGLISGWHGKNPARALRLALVMEYLAWAAQPGVPEPVTISPASVAHAAAYLSYAESMFERAISGLGITQQENDAALIARHIIKAGLTCLNERRLYQTQGFAHLRHTQRRKDALAVLERMGWLMPASKETKGRPRGDWLVNPRLTDVQKVQNPSGIGQSF